DLRGIGKLDIGIEEPAQQIGVFELAGAIDVQGAFHLRPDLVLDFLRRAPHGRLGVQDAGRTPIRNVNREYPTEASVSVTVESVRAPELALRDRGQRPGRVDIDRVAVDHRNVALEIELNSVHPRSSQLVQIGDGRRGALNLVGYERSHDLYRQRGDIVVS